MPNTRSKCACDPQVKVARTIPPFPGSGAAPVALTICDCDRRQCTVNGCHGYSTVVGGTQCRNGHRF